MGAEVTPENLMMTEAELAEIEKRVNAATAGPWAFEGVSEKSNDYIVGIVCPVDEKHDVGPQISGNVQRHPHFYNNDTDEFGEWYCEEIAALDESSHTSDGSVYSDAEFIAHAREDIPRLLAAIRSVSERADGMEREAKTARNTALVNLAGFKNEKKRADAAESRITSLERALREAKEALGPLARLQLPKKTDCNAGAYSLYFTDISRAKELLASALEA